MDLKAKGNLGIRITWLAAIAFFLCILGQTLLLGLLLALVLVVEKNDWLSYQATAAFLLSFVSSLLSAISGTLGSLYSIPLIGSVFSGMFGVVFGIVDLVVFIVAVIGCVKASKGETLNIPVISGIAAAAFTAPAPKVAYAPAQPVYTAPVAPQSAPQSYAAPQQAPAAAPQQPAAGDNTQAPQQ